MTSIPFSVLQIYSKSYSAPVAHYIVLQEDVT